MIMDNGKGNDRSNEVIGSREADDITECGAGKRNSAPIGQRCRLCDGYGFYLHIYPFGKLRPCFLCRGTGREALQELSGCPIVK